jgi:mRNA interferase MazF
VRQAYVSERGDVIRLSFSPQTYREQAGRHPGVVLSSGAFNRRIGLALTCHVTRRVKGWRARQAERAGRAPRHVLADVIARLQPLLGM